MAHIPDGVLSVPVLASGVVITMVGLALALHRFDDRSIPRMAILSAVFFVASLISVPIGPSSIHLLLVALMGVMLGPGMFPAVLVALVLQAVLFGFGGLTTLGVNTANIALPGVIAGMVLGPLVRRTRSVPWVVAQTAVTGAICVLATGGLVALSLWLSSSEFTPVIKVLLITYVPLALVEGVITGVAVGFLKRVKPESLIPHLAVQE